MIRIMKTIELKSKYIIQPAQISQEKKIINFLRKTWQQLKFPEELFQYLPQNLDRYWIDGGSHFQVIMRSNKIMGTISFLPLLSRLDTDVCFLKNFYMHQDMRGLGFGKKMLTSCLENAVEKGYSRVYLETDSILHTALNFYKKYGFEVLPSPLLQTGHPCDTFMLADIDTVLQKLYE